MQWMNSTHTKNVDALTTKYQQAEPFAHMQLDDFLTQEGFDALVDALSTQQFEHKENDLFSLAQTKNLQTVDNDTLESFISFMNSQETRDWFKKITGVQTNPGEIDVFGAIYQDSDYLICHDDQLEDRKIAWILYLTSLDEEQGGALSLFDDDNISPNNKVVSYQPQKNSIAFFTVSDTSWHEVEEVTDEVNRVSIGGWLK